MKEKLRTMLKKGKVLAVAALIAASSAVCSVAASAEDVSAPAVSGNMESMMTDAGEQISGQFNSLVSTAIPVIIGIMGSGLVIFGIFALIKLAKKIFGKVAG